MKSDRCIIRRVMLRGINLKRVVFDDLLTLSCPALRNSSLPKVMETFTEVEPE